MASRRLAPADVQPASFALSPENAAFADAQVAKYPEGRQASAVIALLWEAQKQAGGWLPRAAIEAVAARLDMPVIRVLEVATFYTMFQLEPVGRHLIQLCGTVPCHVKGALDLKQVLLDRVGDERHVTPDGLFSWMEVECLGACCNAPMVQINDDYYEDLTPELLVRLLDDLAAGRPVKPGPQSGRRSSEPAEAVGTLQEPSLYDGSRLGAWRKRFEEGPAVERAAASAAAAPQPTTPGELKAAKPDSGRARIHAATDGPAQRAADGKDPQEPSTRAGLSDPSTTSTVEPRPPSGAGAPQSSKSYTMTPSKPEDGRVAAGARGTTPEAGAPADGGRPRDGAEDKPVGADPNASPGVAPKE